MLLAALFLNYDIELARDKYTSPPPHKCATCFPEGEPLISYKGSMTLPMNRPLWVRFKKRKKQ